MSEASINNIRLCLCILPDICFSINFTLLTYMALVFQGRNPRLFTARVGEYNMAETSLVEEEYKVRMYAHAVNIDNRKTCSQNAGL